MAILPAFFAANIGSQPKKSTTTAIKKEVTTQTNNNTIDNRMIVELLTYAKSVGCAKDRRAKHLTYTHTQISFRKIQQLIHFRSKISRRVHG